MQLYENLNNDLNLNLKSNKDVDWDYILRCVSIPEDILKKYMKYIKKKQIYRYSEYISSYQKLSENFIEKYLDELSFSKICEYQNLSEEFIERHIDLIIDNWCWLTMCKHQNLSEEFIEKHLDELTIINVIKYQNVSEEFMSKHKFFYKKELYKYQSLSESFIEKYKNIANWDYVSVYQNLSETFIENHKDDINWCFISQFQKLSELFIEKWQAKLDWNEISEYQNLSETFIEKYKNKINWKYISKYQTLSEDFIRKHINELDLYYISKYQKLSRDFINENNLKIGDNWLYKDTEFKKQQIINSGLYECYDDYFIAYKAVRQDRYSIYNFQYKYEPGNIYESTCDYTDNEDSFGLNVGTYEFAKDYGSYYFHSIIIKCKVRYEDIGRLVRYGKKIRCRKIEILN